MGDRKGGTPREEERAREEAVGGRDRGNVPTDARIPDRDHETLTIPVSTQDPYFPDVKVVETKTPPPRTCRDLILRVPGLRCGG